MSESSSGEGSDGNTSLLQKDSMASEFSHKNQISLDRGNTVPPPDWGEPSNPPPPEVESSYPTPTEELRKTLSKVLSKAAEKGGNMVSVGAGLLATGAEGARNKTKAAGGAILERIRQRGQAQKTEEEQTEEEPQTPQEQQENIELKDMMQKAYEEYIEGTDTEDPLGVISGETSPPLELSKLIAKEFFPDHKDELTGKLEGLYDLVYEGDATKIIEYMSEDKINEFLSEIVPDSATFSKEDKKRIIKNLLEDPRTREVLADKIKEVFDLEQAAESSSPAVIEAQKAALEQAVDELGRIEKLIRKLTEERYSLMELLLTENKTQLPFNGKLDATSIYEQLLILEENKQETEIDILLGDYDGIIHNRIKELEGLISDLESRRGHLLQSVEELRKQVFSEDYSHIAKYRERILALLSGGLKSAIAETFQQKTEELQRAYNSYIWEKATGLEKKLKEMFDPTKGANYALSLKLKDHPLNIAWKILTSPNIQSVGDAFLVFVEQTQSAFPHSSDGKSLSFAEIKALREQDPDKYKEIAEKWAQSVFFSKISAPSKSLWKRLLDGPWIPTAPSKKEIKLAVDLLGEERAEQIAAALEKNPKAKERLKKALKKRGLRFPKLNLSLLIFLLSATGTIYLGMNPDELAQIAVQAINSK